MAGQIRCWLAIVSICCAARVSAQTPRQRTVPSRSASVAAGQEKEPLSGSLAGRVTDRRGVAQAGVTVTILRQDGRYLEKIYTLPNGSFRLNHLAPGTYAAEVAQPSFLPYWKSPIAIQAGAEFLLDINLLSLADSVEIGVPESLKDAADDWKWVLRSSYPQRPVLRFRQDTRPSPGGAIHDPRERALRGTVQIVAGNESHGFGQNPALRTAFDMTYSLPGSQLVALAGSAGFERGTPAASLRAAWSRASGDDANGTLSMTVRQLFLPGEYWTSGGDLALPSGRRVQSLTVGYEEEKALGEHLRLQMGSLYDTLSFDRRMTRWSPFARLTYSPAEHSQLTIAFTAANPRLLPSDGEAQHQNVDQSLAIPQISAGLDGQPVLEGGRHLEAQWEQHWSPQFRLQGAVFYDVLSQTALSLALSAADGMAVSLLRDPFSDRYFLSGGSLSSPGLRIAVAMRLASNSDLIVGYGYAGTLETVAGEMLVSDAQALRRLLEARRENSFTVKTISRIPESRTRVIASYRWLARNALVVADPYDRGWGQSEPFLNLDVIQPLPSPDILPGQFEAVADFNNLLAQGYLTIHTPGGTSGRLFPASRSFRGGFNFIF